MQGRFGFVWRRDAAETEQGLSGGAVEDWRRQTRTEKLYFCVLQYTLQYVCEHKCCVDGCVVVGSLVMMQWQWMAKILFVEQELVYLAEKDENEL